MPEFELHITIRPVPGAFEIVLLKRTVEAPWLPRLGEDLLIGDGGWSQPVTTVWHEPGKRTVVEIGKPTGVDDTHGEGLVNTARAAGFR